MPRMIDLIRASAVPATLMHSAAKGALSVPPDEIIEILVYLATQNPVFGQQARFTLAGWDEAASSKVAANPKAPKSVLEYWIAAENVRPALLPVLLENPSVTEHHLLQLAEEGSREVAETMLKSPRVSRSPRLVAALHRNVNLLRKPVEAEATPPEAKAAPIAAGPDDAPAEFEVVAPEISDESSSIPEAELNDALNAYLTEHADEIAAAGEKFFQAIGGTYDEIEIKQPAPPQPVPAEAPARAAPETDKKRALVAKKTYLSEEEKRGSVLQKISKLDIKGRIQLAMKGNKEERGILVRDGTKLVALAVLDSPKITDGEVERYASQKNVLEAVLRGIPMKRRFAKHYPIIRNLVFNPRTPIDLSLGLMKNLLTQDLKNLSGNKEVSDTIRKLALKMFKMKQDPSKKNV